MKVLSNPQSIDDDHHCDQEIMDLKTWLLKHDGTQSNNKNLHHPVAPTAQQSSDPAVTGSSRQHPGAVGASQVPELAAAAVKNANALSKKHVPRELGRGKKGFSALQVAAAVIVKKAMKKRTGSAAPATDGPAAIAIQTSAAAVAAAAVAAAAAAAAGHEVAEGPGAQQHVLPKQSSKGQAAGAAAGNIKSNSNPAAVSVLAGGFI
jgi:hypothetical protein